MREAVRAVRGEVPRVHGAGGLERHEEGPALLRLRRRRRDRETLRAQVRENVGDPPLLARLEGVGHGAGPFLRPERRRVEHRDGDRRRRGVRQRHLGDEVRRAADDVEHDGEKAGDGRHLERIADDGARPRAVREELLRARQVDREVVEGGPPEDVGPPGPGAGERPGPRGKSEEDVDVRLGDGRVVA